MLNTIFQFYNLIIRPIKAPNPEVRLGSLSRMQAVLKRGLFWARLFKRDLIVIAGDTNGAGAMKSFGELSLFKSFVVNIALPGSRFDEWISLTRNAWLLSALNDPRVRLVWNLGLNHVLALDMKLVAGKARSLKARFGNSWGVTTPLLVSGANRLHATRMNGIIRDVWPGGQCIDIAAVIGELVLDAQQFGCTPDVRSVLSEDGSCYVDAFLQRALIPYIQTHINNFNRSNSKPC